MVPFEMNYLRKYFSRSIILRGGMRLRWDIQGGKEHRTQQSWRSKDKLIYLISLQKVKPLWWARNNTALI